jgi:hypothetical protein
MITEFKIKRDGEFIELEVEFDGYIEQDEDGKFFQLEEIISAEDEDYNDWLEDLTEEEMESLEEKCEKEGFKRMKNDDIEENW